VTAEFAIDTFTLTYTAGTNGAISGVSPQTVNYGSSGTSVTAVADTGYHFVRWSDGVLTAARTETNVTADSSVTAEFAIDTFTLTYTAGAHGAITGVSPQTVNYGANGTEVTAVADTGYHFVRWSDGVLTAVRTETNVTADSSVTATFAADGAPNPPLVAGSASLTNNKRPTWTWTSGGNGAGVYRYGWSEGAWIGEGAATSYTPSADLANSAHTLYVQERNAAMVWSDSGAFLVTIDLVPPQMTAVSVEPAEATEGTLLTIGLAFDEPLNDVPSVTVNGHPATYTRTETGNLHLYTYLVQEPSVDLPGWAEITITASDLAGNIRVNANSDKLRILPEEEKLPTASLVLLTLLGICTAFCGIRVLRYTR
jgi:hypothetical protein